MPLSVPASQQRHAHATFFKRSASTLSAADATADDANEDVLAFREAATSSITYRLTSDSKEFWNLSGIELTKSGTHVPVSSRWVAASSTQPGYDAADLFQDWTFRTPSKMAWSPAYQAEGPPYWVQWEAGDADTVKICQSAHQHETVTLTRSDRAGSIQLPLKKVLNTWISFSIGKATDSFDLPVDCPCQRITGFDAALDIDPSAKTSRVEPHGRDHCVHSLVQRDADSEKCSECQRWIFVGEQVTACVLCNHHLCALCHPQEHPQAPVWQGFLNTLGVGLRDGQAFGTKIEKEIQMEMDSLRSMFQQCQPTGCSQESFEQPVEVPADGLVPKQIGLRPDRGERFFAMISRLEDDAPLDEEITLQEVDEDDAGSSCVAPEELSKKQCAIDVQPVGCPTSKILLKEHTSKYASYLQAVAHTEASEISNSISKPASSASYPASANSSKVLAGRYAACLQTAAHTKASQIDNSISKAVALAPRPTSAHSSNELAGNHTVCSQPAAHTKASKIADFASESVASTAYPTSDHSPKNLAENYVGCMQLGAHTEGSKPANPRKRGFSLDRAKGQGRSGAPPVTPRRPTGTRISSTHVEHSQCRGSQVAVAPEVIAAGAAKNQIRKPEETLASESDIMTQSNLVAEVLDANIGELPVSMLGASRMRAARASEAKRAFVEGQDARAIEHQTSGTVARVYNALCEALEGLPIDNVFIASATNKVQILNSKIGDLAVHIKDGVVHATGQAEAEKVHVKATIIKVKGVWSLSLVEAVGSVEIQCQDAAQVTMIKADGMKNPSVAALEVGKHGLVAEVGHTQDLTGVPKIQAIAAGAVVGAGAGGATGLAAGLTAGTAVGLLFVPFTLGLSLPVGAAIGGGTGTGLGAVAGTTLGAIGGKYASENYMEVKQVSVEKSSPVNGSEGVDVETR